METLKRSIFSFTIADLVSKGILYFLVTPVGTGHKLNVHKTFRRRPGRLMYLQFTSCVHGEVITRPVAFTIEDK